MKEICRVCKDGCVVTIKMPQSAKGWSTNYVVDPKQELWAIGAPKPFNQTTPEMLSQFKSCMGKRLKKDNYKFIRRWFPGDGSGGGNTYLVFQLSAGACGKCP